MRPKMRYWLPLGKIDPQAVRHDIARIAQAGFGGVELISIPDDAGVVAQQAYGGSEWQKAVQSALSEARKQGITVDLAIGPLYPAAVPQSEIDDNASRELTFTAIPVSGRFTGQLLRPPEAIAAQLVGVSAMRVTGMEDASTLVDRASLIDLTPHAADGGLDWTPPGPGEWRIVASWSRAVGHRITGAGLAPYMVVDHFSQSATDKIIRHWQSDVLPKLGPDRAAVRDIFEDSLHLQGYSLWTPDLLSVFQERRGYDLKPYLPVLSIGHLNDFFFAIFNHRDLTPRSKPDYDFADGSGAKIRDDYYQTLSELYSERHLAPLQQFFASQGLKLRAQPSYGQSLDGTAPLAHVDVPETESFQLDDLVEAYKVQAGAVHVLGKPVYSAECCAMPGAAGKTDWNEAWKHIGGLYTGGVNQIVFHGYAQTTSHTPGQADWLPFGGMFSENYATIAAWSQAPAMTAFLARQQAVLRAGQPALDLAIVRHSFWDNGHAKVSPGFDYWTDQGLDAAGYTHDYVAPALLTARQWEPQGGIAAPRGAAYRAILVMPGQALPVSALDGLLRSAQAGVPVVLVGALPTPLGIGPDNQTFVQKLADLRASPMVSAIADASEASKALAAQGIAPRIASVGPSAFQMVMRRLPQGHLVWLRNPADHTVTQTLHTAGRNVSGINLAHGGSRVIPFHKSARALSWDVTLKSGESAAYLLKN